MQSRHTKLRIGIVGAGSIVRKRHLPALNQIEDVKIVGVCNSSYDSSEKFCSEVLPEAKPYANWAELVAEADVDIIWIGTPPYLHATIAVSALEAGKHVFCQARMAMNLTEAEEMCAAVQRHPHLVTMLCPPPHGLRGSRLIQKLLADEYVGRPHHLRLHSFTGDYLDQDAPPHWRQRDEYSGLNVLSLGSWHTFKSVKQIQIASDFFALQKCSRGRGHAASLPNSAFQNATRNFMVAYIPNCL